MEININIIIDEIIEALDKKKGYSLVRIGDGENIVLSGEILKHSIWDYRGENKIEGSSMQMARLMLTNAIREASMIGCFVVDDWTKRSFEIQGLKYPPDRYCYAWLNLFLCTRLKFLKEVLMKHKFLLLGFPMKEWAEKFLKPLGVNYFVPSIKYDISNMYEYDIIRNEMRNNDFDIALISMGVWAPALANEALHMNKVGIDYGHAPNHNFINEYPINTQYEDIEEYYRHSKCPVCLK